MQRGNMDEQEAEGTSLKEHLIWHEHREDKLEAALEYLRDIPLIKADIKMIKADIREINVKLTRVEGAVGLDN
jgi:hypothetical protein